MFLNHLLYKRILGQNRYKNENKIYVNFYASFFYKEIVFNNCEESLPLDRYYGLNKFILIYPYNSFHLSR